MLTFSSLQLLPNQDLQSLLDKVDVIHHGAGSVDEDVNVAFEDRAEDFARSLTQPRDASLEATHRRVDATLVLPVFLGSDVDVGDTSVAPRNVSECATGTIRCIHDFALK